MKKLFLSIATGLLFSAVLILHSAPVGASFTANDLIDDNIFNNSTSMSSSGIDAWLNANFPHSCISTNNHFTAPDPIGYNPTQGYLYGGNVSAGRVIADAANAYSINPQVLISTLEKESSVVTGNASYHCTYINTAMGYGCPDSGSCPTNPATMSGFSKQVIHAAWLLKFGEQRSEGNVGFNVQKSGWDNSDDVDTYYGGPMTQGNHQRVSSGPSTYFDGYTSIDGTSVHMDTGGTAALYWYTPHFHGNQLFVSIFEGWFGSTTGELARTTTSGQVYIVNTDTNKKYPINSQGFYNDLSRLGLRYVSASYLNAIPTGNAYTGMIQDDSTNSLYLVNASIKLKFTSCSGDVVSYGYTCASTQYIPLTASQTAKLSNGPNVSSFMKSNNSSTIYYMSNGQKRPFQSMSDLTSLHVPTPVNVFNSTLVNRYPTTTPFYGYGSLVKTASSNTVYAVKDATHLMTVGSFTYPSELGLGTSVRTMSSSAFQNTYGSASGAAALTNKVLCSATDYIGTNGLPLYKVSAGVASAYGYSSGDFTDVGAICKVLHVNRQSLGQYIRDNSGTIYYVSSSQKRPFGSYGAFQSAPYCNNSCEYDQVSNYFSGTLTTGAKIN